MRFSFFCFFFLLFLCFEKRCVALIFIWSPVPGSAAECYEPPLIAVPALTLLLLNSPCHLGSSGAWAGKIPAFWDVCVWGFLLVFSLPYYSKDLGEWWGSGRGLMPIDVVSYFHTKHQITQRILFVVGKIDFSHRFWEENFGWGLGVFHLPHLPWQTQRWTFTV